MKLDRRTSTANAGPEESPTSVSGEPDVGPWGARRRTITANAGPVPGEPDVGPWRARRRTLRVPLEGIVLGERELSKEAANYVVRVHRLGEGDTFTAFDPELAIEADTVILASSARSVRVRIEDVRPAEVVAPREVTLVQALGKGDKLDAIVRDATELGVSRIVPVIAERSVVRPTDASARLARWRRIAIEASRQCGRGDAARIDAPVPLIEAVRALAQGYASFEEAPGGAEALLRSSVAPWGVCLDPAGSASLGDVLLALPPEAPFTIVVGPEGGLAREEIVACEEAGLARARMGPLVLRTETVCAAVLGALMILGERGAVGSSSGDA